MSCKSLIVFRISVMEHKYLHLDCAWYVKKYILSNFSYYTIVCTVVEYQMTPAGRQLFFLYYYHYLGGICTYTLNISYYIHRKYMFCPCESDWKEHAELASVVFNFAQPHGIWNAGASARQLGGPTDIHTERQASSFERLFSPWNFEALITLP